MSQKVHVNARRHQDMKENARRCLKKMVGDLEATGGIVSKRVSRRGKDPKVEKDLNIPWEWTVFSRIIIRERLTLCSSGMWSMSFKLNSLSGMWPGLRWLRCCCIPVAHQRNDCGISHRLCAACWCHCLCKLAFSCRYNKETCILESTTCVPRAVKPRTLYDLRLDFTKVRSRTVFPGGNMTKWKSKPKFQAHGTFRLC